MSCLRSIDNLSEEVPVGGFFTAQTHVLSGSLPGPKMPAEPLTETNPLIINEHIQPFGESKPSVEARFLRAFVAHRTRRHLLCRNSKTQRKKLRCN